jgi:hypothetical protein
VPWQEIEFEHARLAISEHILLALWVSLNAARKVRPGRAAIHWRHRWPPPIRGLAPLSAVTAPAPALVAGLSIVLRDN